MDTSGYLYVYETGTNRGVKGMYSPTDVLQVRVNSNSQVEYVRNGAIIYTSTVTPSLPMVADCSFASAGGAINNFKWITSTGFDSVSTGITNGATVALSLAAALTQSGSTITKSSSVAAGWNEGASSAVAINTNSQGIQFSAAQTNGYIMVGLSTVGTDVTFSYTDIDFAMYPRADGSLYVYESGSSRGSVGTYTTSSVFQVRVNSGGSIEYVKDGTVVYTSSVSPTLPLAVDMSFYTAGKSITGLQWITSAGFS